MNLTAVKSLVHWYVCVLTQCVLSKPLLCSLSPPNLELTDESGKEDKFTDKPKQKHTHKKKQDG